MYDICITLVATNELEQFKRMLPSLMEDIQESDLNTKIVIIDNHSTDGTKAWVAAQYPDITYIEQPKNLGFGRSHNRGMQSTDAKYYFVLNPDTMFEPKQAMLRKMYDYMEANDHVGMIGPKIFYPDGSFQYSCYRFPTFLQPLYSRTSLGKSGKGKKIADSFQMKDFDHNSTIPVDWIMGSAMFVRKKAIDDVGMFDDRYFMYAEDSDWCRRMWEKNWAVYYVHDLVIKHYHGRASAKVPGAIRAILTNKYARIHIRSWMKFFWKWRGNSRFYGASNHNK
jgi:GT2 family glycosyltransferase